MKNLKDILVRAAKTFVQSFMGAVSIDIITATTDRSIWRSVLLGGIAAGISAVWNFIYNEIKEENTNAQS